MRPSLRERQRIVGLCVALLLPPAVAAQSITTFAGGGTIGDGRPANGAVLSNPADVAIDGAGNIYIADRQNFRVRRVDASTGIVSTFAGGGTSGPGDGESALQGEIFNPTGIALDAEGNLFIAEETRNRIRRVDAETGVLSTVAGDGSDLADGIPATEALIRSIGDVAVDAEGNIYFSDILTHRVRRIDASTGLVTTIAGTGNRGSGGDDGPATEAELDAPDTLALGPGPALFVAELGPRTIRRIDLASGSISTLHSDEFPVRGLAAGTGILYFTAGGVIKGIDVGTGEIRTIAGTADRSFSGDGGPATAAALNNPQRLAADGEQLLIADTWNRRIRRVDLATGVIETIAGGGPVGDGGPATAANLSVQTQIALSPNGDLIIADLYRLRRVSAATGRIESIAGDGIAEFSGDGGPATAARLGEQRSVAIDDLGNVYVGTSSPLSGAGRVRRIDADSGIIETVAGNGTFGFDGDGGPAVEASLGRPFGLALDREGNLYIADGDHHVVRRVDAADRTITTIAGTGLGGFSGDGGPASEAQLAVPLGLAFDSNQHLHIADRNNRRIRRVDAVTGTISTVAGTGSGEYGGDGGPAVEAGISLPLDVAFDGAGNLYVADAGSWRIRKIDAATSIISTVTGTGEVAWAGDGGPAAEASLTLPRGIAVAQDGTLFISDQTVGRVRVIYPCTEIGAIALTSPADRATGLSTAPTLTWDGPERAFRYDLLLGKQGTPFRIAAPDLTTSSFTPQNLEQGATYLWQVRAKGDPFCIPQSESFSLSRTFTVAPRCEAPPAPALTAPAGGATLGNPSTTLAWNPTPGASSYDVHLGSSFPPPFLASTSGTTFTTADLIAGTTYHWSIVAHAACNPALTSRSETRSFFLAGPCDPAGELELLAPEDGATNVGTTVELSWSPSENATSYDLSLGTTNPPAIFRSGIQSTSIAITGFDSGRTYFWSVRANTACDDGGSRATPIRSFNTGDACVRPGGTSIVLAPPGPVGAGQTYTIAWRPATGLDAGGTYVVERSLDPGFATILDAQALTGTSATFVAGSARIHYHRVRPVTRCNPDVTGPDSATVAVEVIPEEPNVIFTVEPEAVISRPGRNLEDLSTGFTLENISSAPVSVILGRAEIASPPFFTIADPLGGDSAFVTLEPRQPKSFEIRFSGPRSDVEGAYQGLVVVNTVGSTVTPYAFVNLKVGDQASAAPEFRLDGAPAEYAFFPPFDGDDANRAPIAIEIHNPGATPMELGAEIGPDVWLEPEPAWNATPIPAGATRTVKLFTRRNRALDGSALPRYTYFTVRTRTGESARFLVQDNGTSSLAPGRTVAGDAESFIVPHVVSKLPDGHAAVVSRLRLTNLGSSPVQAEVLFTPSGADGFSDAVRSTTIVVPPTDVVTLTDPLVQVFGLSRPAEGQIEVRAAKAAIGLLSISSTLVSEETADASLTRIPTIPRQAGARAGSPHQIGGIVSSAGETTRLVLAETSGTAAARARLTLHDGNGVLLGEQTVDLERFGHRSFADLAASFGVGGSPSSAHLRIEVDDDGAVAGLALIEGARDRAAAILGTPIVEDAAAAAMRWPSAIRPNQVEVTRTLVAPYVASGRVVEGGAVFSTVMGFQGVGGTSEYLVTYTDTGGEIFEETVRVSSGLASQYQNVLAEVFGIAEATEGTLRIEGDPRGHVYARLRADGLPAGTIDLISSISELVTTSASARPLFVEGVEQSTDPTRGTLWNLYVQEIGGESGNVTVRLYEAGNRASPFAVKDFSIGPAGRLEMETLFDAMDLNTEIRRKDRANVLVMVTPKDGAAQIAAVAVEIDNRTGAPTAHTLQPASGVSPGGASSTLVREVELGAPPTRRRPVGRTE